MIKSSESTSRHFHSTKKKARKNEKERFNEKEDTPPTNASSHPSYASPSIESASAAVGRSSRGLSIAAIVVSTTFGTLSAPFPPEGRVREPCTCSVGPAESDEHLSGRQRQRKNKKMNENKRHVQEAAVGAT